MNSLVYAAIYVLDQGWTTCGHGSLW